MIENSVEFKKCCFKESETFTEYLLKLENSRSGQLSPASWIRLCRSSISDERRKLWSNLCCLDLARRKSKTDALGIIASYMILISV